MSTTNHPSDHYATLGVDQTSPHAAIAAAHRRIMRRVHPDVAGADPAARERALAANLAWTVLKDPVSRAGYDRQLSRAIATKPIGQGTVTIEQLREAAARHAAYGPIGKEHREAFSAASRRVGISVLVVCTVLLALLVIP